jgi:nucleoside-diphosphate-sugar epimerase
MAPHLITGGAGFFGSSNIARRLIERNESFRVLDLWRDESMSSDIEFARSDINDRDGIRRAMKGVDYVYHTVALVPLAKVGKRFWTVSVDGTRMALEEAARAEVKCSVTCLPARSSVHLLRCPSLTRRR